MSLVRMGAPVALILPCSIRKQKPGGASYLRTCPPHSLVPILARGGRRGGVQPEFNACVLAAMRLSPPTFIPSNLNPNAALDLKGHALLQHRESRLIEGQKWVIPVRVGVQVNGSSKGQGKGGVSLVVAYRVRVLHVSREG